MANNTRKDTKITETFDPRQLKVSFGEFVGIGVVTAIVTFVITLVLCIIGVINGDTMWSLVGGFAIASPTFFSTMGAIRARSVMKYVAEDIESGLKGFADHSFKPTKEQYRDLLIDGKAIPFTIKGVSGAKLIRVKVAGEHDARHADVFEYEIHLAVDAVDDGMASFQRLIKRAIDSDPDIKAAASL